VRKEENDDEVGGGETGQGDGVSREAVVGSLLSENADLIEVDALGELVSMKGLISGLFEL